MGRKAEPAENFINKKFGLLTVIKDMGLSLKGRKVECICECGKKYFCRLYTLKRGDTISCGCYKQMKVMVHGLKYHPLYTKWLSMRARCFNKKLKQYMDYGGRGITVCDEWKDNFKAFYEWAIVNGWKDGLSLDRYPDNDGNYEPSNCRWATTKQQARNTRASKTVIFNGQRKGIAELAEEAGISLNLLHHRLKAGWTINKAVSNISYGKDGKPLRK